MEVFESLKSQPGWQKNARIVLPEGKSHVFSKRQNAW